MDGAGELRNVAEELLDLSRVPGLKVESSPAAMRRLRNAYDRIVRTSAALLADSNGPDTVAFHRARLADCIRSLHALLTAVETTGYSSHDPVRAVAQLASELLEIAQDMAEISGDQDKASDHNEVAARARNNLLRDQRGAEVLGTGSRLKTPARSGSAAVRKQERLLDADEAKTIPFVEVKRKQLQKRRTLLVSQYEAASDQLRSTQSAADVVLHKNKLSQIEQEIKGVEEELESLA